MALGGWKEEEEKTQEIKTIKRNKKEKQHTSVVYPKNKNIKKSQLKIQDPNLPPYI